MFRQLVQNQYGLVEHQEFYKSTRDCKALVQRMKRLSELDVHMGCVNTICWNETGEYILSGSDDIHLCICNAYTFKKKALIRTGHRNNIFSAKFLPNTNDRQVVSCSGDGIIMYTNLDSPFSSGNNSFNCHYGTTYEIRVVPNDPFSFLSCGEDGTVRWFDLRTKTGCSKANCKEDVLINCHKAVTAICINPVAPYELAVGCSDSTVRIYDRRRLGTQATGSSFVRSINALQMSSSVSDFQNRTHRITSLCYNSTGDELLVSYSGENVYLYKIKDDAYMTYSSTSKQNSSKSQGRCTSSAAPPMKRLRVRGDWSDTGPNARPESESVSGGRNNSNAQDLASRRNRTFRSNLMQRMSDVLTRMLNEPSQSADTSNNTNVSSDTQSSQQSADDAPGASETSEITRGASSNLVGNDTSTISESLGDQRQDVNVSPGINQSASEKNESTGSDCVERNINDVRENTRGSDNSETKEETVRPPVLQTVEDSFASTSHDPASTETNRHASGFSQCEKIPEENESRDPSPNPECGKNIIKENIKSLESDLRLMRQDFIDKNKMEPVVNLHYNARSVNSGLISMDVSDAQEQRRPYEENDDDSEELPQSTGHDAPTKSDRDNLIDNLSKSDDGACKDDEDRNSTSGFDDGISRPSCSDTSQKPGDLEASLEASKPSTSQENTGERKVNDEPSVAGESNERAIEPSDDQENASTFDPASPLIDVAMASDSDDDIEISSEGELDEDVLTAVRDQIVGSTREEMPSHAIIDEMEEACTRTRADIESEEQEIIMELPQFNHVRSYHGHRNGRTMIKEANFWGDRFIVSGSDCGHVFFWDKDSKEVVMLLEADKHVVNCVQPHPYDPILATSGIDYDVKLWAPIAEDSCFNSKRATEIMKRNEIMLEESKDTITVPASFMIRMLASLNHIRSAGVISTWRNRVRRNRNPSNDDNE